MTPGSARWWRELGLEAPGEAPATASAATPAAGRRGSSPENSSCVSAALDRTRTPASPERTPVAPPERTDAASRARTHAASPDLGRAAGIAALSWEDFALAVDTCCACGLRAGRRRSVPGVGDHRARWLFVGEAPGAEEDQRGEPFVGAAGQLLDAMLAGLGLRRGEGVYIANVVKCRPPANRTPDAGECAACQPFLERQIALIRPHIIVALGRVAAQTLLASPINVGSLRGKVHQVQGIPLVVTYHPAYLLRSLGEKARAWADLCLAQRTLAGHSADQA